MTRVYAYGRTSTGDQDLGIEKQNQKVEDYCDRKGYELIEFRSNQISGMKEVVELSDHKFDDEFVEPHIFLKNRPVIDDLFHLVQKEDADKIVVYNPSRLARSMRTQQLLEFLFDEIGCEVEYIDVPEDWIGKNITSMIYEYEVRQTRKRTKESLERKKENDEWMGRPPVGYKTEKDENGDPTGNLVKDRPLWSWLKEAENYYESKEEVGYKTVADEFSERSGLDIKKHQVRSFIKRDREKIQRFLKGS